MNTGYVFFCGESAIAACLSKRAYTCAANQKNEAAAIKRGTILFFYNTEIDSLLGPFTAASEGAQTMETGTWRSTVNEHSASENIQVEWEDLHIIAKAGERFTFLKNREKCALPPIRVQEILDALATSPQFQG
jgi:hypothetical protein